ncbi:tetratricopeptide repeat protein [Algibacter miyuki]|uniref:Tetratricopeptide repeat protein n=1 Tax=Algibacter miyuki TaxID=1306933 RepID=A0ABV5GZN3_9FLAO|nr:tetratricopeptide repeat protein [Algibacter miyuki]MDN3666699.1 tetratricopeptide repeat protein [Algibacter miyuki]
MKKSIIVIIVLLPLFMFGQANKLFRKALKTEDLKERVELLDQAISINPDKLDAYFYRAIAKNDLGDYTGAIVDYSKIIIEEPDADSYFNRGNARYSLADFEGAKADYLKATELDPYFIDALYSLGCAHFDLGNYDEAIEVFNLVVIKEPYYAKVYTMRGLAYEHLDNFKKAIDNYTVAVLMDPSADTYYNRGVYLLGINYYKKAKSDFSQVISRNENNSFAYFYRGACHFLLGKYKNADTDFSTALKFDSLDFDAMLGLSMMYYKQNDLANSKAYFDKAKAILQSNGNTTSGIELFENTYWYKNQFYFFTGIFKEIDQL